MPVGQRLQIPLELELKVVVSQLTGVLETELSSCGRVENAFTHWAIFAVYFKNLKDLFYKVRVFCVHVCMCAMCMPVPAEVTTGHHSLWNWSCRYLWATLWVLGIEPGPLLEGQALWPAKHLSSHHPLRYILRRVSPQVTKTDLEFLVILLPQPCKCCDYRFKPLFIAWIVNSWEHNYYKHLSGIHASGMERLMLNPRQLTLFRFMICYKWKKLVYLEK